MKPSLIISSAIVALGIVVLGFALKSGIDRFSDRDRVVTVRGLCEKEVKANKVTLPIVTKEIGNDLVTIYNKIENSNKTIISFLKANGLTDNEISVNAPQIFDAAADRYGNQNVVYR